jgi:hypothetical protein
MLAVGIFSVAKRSETRVASCHLLRDLNWRPIRQIRSCPVNGAPSVEHAECSDELSAARAIETPTAARVTVSAQ